MRRVRSRLMQHRDHVAPGSGYHDHKAFADAARVALALPNGRIPVALTRKRARNVGQAIALAMPARYTPAVGQPAASFLDASVVIGLPAMR